MKYGSLSPRLKLIASLVPAGSVPVDVGTDHGYIPAWLLKNGVVSRCLATDINKGPLASAERTLTDAGIRDRCELILCDGLAGCAEGCADVVIAAGMGGDNISGILERAPWVKKCRLLILQPMSKAERLRSWLCANGYEISGERLVKDSGKVYPVICAQRAEKNFSLTEAEKHTGVLELVSKEPLFEAFLNELITKYERAVASQRTAGTVSAHLNEMQELLEAFKKIREENFA